MGRGCFIKTYTIPRVTKNPSPDGSMALICPAERELGIPHFVRDGVPREPPTFKFFILSSIRIYRKRKRKNKRRCSHGGKDQL